jgi:hypothetical protein
LTCCRSFSFSLFAWKMSAVQFHASSNGRATRFAAISKGRSVLEAALWKSWRPPFGDSRK